MNNFTLEDGEQILWQGKPNAKVYKIRAWTLWIITTILVVTIITGWAYYFFNTQTSQSAFVYIMSFVVLVVIATGYFMWKSSKKELAKEYTLTNKRVINVGVNHFFFSGMPEPIIVELSEVTYVRVKYHFADVISKQHTGTIEIETPLTTIRSSKGTTRVPFVLRNINKPEDVLQLLEQYIQSN